MKTAEEVAKDLQSHLLGMGGVVSGPEWLASISQALTAYAEEYAGKLVKEALACPGREIREARAKALEAAAMVAEACHESVVAWQIRALKNSGEENT